MDRAGFDPRYSPEFQRGFAPSVNEAPASTAEAVEGIAPVARPVAQRIPPAPITPPPARQVLPGQAAEDTGGFGQEPADGGPAPDTLPGSPWRNPYIVALTVLGVVLIGGGIAAFRWSVGQVFGGTIYESGASVEEMEEAMLAAQLAWGLAPLLTLAGVLTLLGVFFFVAWRWQPRLRRVEDDNDGTPIPY